MSSANGRPDILATNGEFFDFINPENSVFDVDVIAWHLSKLCRFTGAVRCVHILSVAEHAILVSKLVPPELAWAGLHHDDAEAFVGDMAKPLKRLCPDYQAIERRVETEVLRRFGLSLPLPPEVKVADIQAREIERYWFMPKAETWQDHSVPELDPRDWPMEGMRPMRALAEFKKRYNELVGQAELAAVLR
jgi:uncharacterized protein